MGSSKMLACCDRRLSNNGSCGSGETVASIYCYVGCGASHALPGNMMAIPPEC